MEQEIKTWLEQRFQDSLAGNFEKLLPYFSENAKIVAAGESFASVQAYLTFTTKKLGKGFDISGYQSEVKMLGEIALTTENYQYAYTTQTGQAIQGQEYLTGVVLRQEGQWKIVQMHISFKRF
jgi:ketosteroid isomerase-like protein